MKLSATIFCLAALATGIARARTPSASESESRVPLPAQLDLASAVRYALDHNYAILQAREQIRQQEGVIVQVRAQEIPNVLGTGGYQRNAAAVSQSSLPETSLWTVEVKATQALFAGGGIDASVKGAKLTRDAALYNLQATINAALLDVRTRFYSVLLAREQVRVQEENIKLFQRELQDAQNQFHAGSVSNFEVLRAQVSLANAQPDLISARNNLRISIEQLRQSLGVPSGPAGIAVPFPEVVGTLDVSPQPYSLEAALGSALANRPELLQLGKQKDAGEQSVRAAKSTYYPNLSAFGGYEWGGLNAVGTAALPGGYYGANGWVIGLQSSWAIFDGRATAGRVQQARSLLNQAELSYASAELAVDVEVRQAYSALQDAAELVAASQKTIEQAVEALRLAHERYHAGSATQLDELTSQVALTQARTNQLQANYNYLVAVAALRKAIGLGDAQVGN
jgi:outer membrane protein TolC